MGDQDNIDCPLRGNIVDQLTNGRWINEVCRAHPYERLGAADAQVGGHSLCLAVVTSDQSQVDQTIFYPQTGAMLGNGRGGPHDDDSFFIVWHFKLLSDVATGPN